MQGTLSDRDHDLMDAFLAEMADALASARLSKPVFIEAMAYVMTALDIGNRDEARFCFKAGVEHFRPDAPVLQTAAIAEPTSSAAPPSSGSVIVLSDRRDAARHANHPESDPYAETRAPRRSR